MRQPDASGFLTGSEGGDAAMAEPGGPPRLALAGISRRYPGVVANDGVSLAVWPGEIHGLIGENGAGKSTLMRIVCGATQPDAGTIFWEGRPRRLASPAVARTLGIAMAFQHFAQFESLTVAENLALALPAGTARASIAARVEAFGSRHGLVLDPDAPLHRLAAGQRQVVEILRALLQAPRLLILDEPTSVLPAAVAEALFATLGQLAADGVSILYLSHRLDEIRRLCSRATVMRAGRVVARCEPARETVASLSRLMFGGEAGDGAGTEAAPGTATAPNPRSTAPGPSPVLEVRALSLEAGERRGGALDAVSLTVDRGQILGIAGVAGNGQAALLAAIVGEDRRVAREAIWINGRAVGDAGVEARRRLGLAYVPEDRVGAATVADFSLERNLLLTHDDPALFRAGLIRRRLARRRTAAILAAFDVRAAGPTAAARSLSGGNLQKFVVGRELARSPSLVILAQPTWGVDLAAATRIRSTLKALSRAGAAVLVVSEDLEELLALADVIRVMKGGRLTPPIEPDSAREEGPGRQDRPNRRDRLDRLHRLDRLAREVTGGGAS